MLLNVRIVLFSLFTVDWNLIYCLAELSWVFFTFVASAKRLLNLPYMATCFAPWRVQTLYIHPCDFRGLLVGLGTVPRAACYASPLQLRLLASPKPFLGSASFSRGESIRFRVQGYVLWQLLHVLGGGGNRLHTPAQLKSLSSPKPFLVVSQKPVVLI